ncbi:hypothetical protein TH63_13990 [Rufibacter radiotolerans]|uniref:Por secretion system C-terminal sorting domain n=2 Tax=Rufibacter radiotolerans TaxID=1379910 RepID=A0A0H4VRB3_9BACT|nr:hypothetical protein TH63_13990 [Rufibacter radiotolerans]
MELTGNVVGGSGNFTYLWTDAGGNLLGTNKTFMAPAVGEYFLEVRTENYPNCSKFSTSVKVVTDLTVNAGPDQLVCSQNPVSLTGAVTAATGGIWSGGAGTFSPSATALNAVYTPTASEIAAGSVRLTLTSTGNGNCTAVRDEVLVSFYSMQLTLTGTPVICSGSTGSVTAAVTGGVGTVTYKWNTGETTASITNKPAGTYTVTVSDGNSCAISKSFTVVEKPGPSDFTMTPKASTCGASNGELAISGVIGGTAPYTYSKDGTTFQASPTFTALTAGSYTLQVKDANGCIVTKTITLQNIAGPSDFTASIQATTCGASNGSISVSNVVSGTAPYTYSINGGSFQASTSFSGLTAGTHSITVKDVNGCITTKSVTVANIAGPTGFVFAAASSTCGASNGSISVSSVTGGTAPYTYSKDGTTFQTTSSISGLAAGTYSITVKDANGCTTVQQVQVTNIAGPSDLAASSRASTCGSTNGELTVGPVTGGTAPYTYSKDGTNFQASATFGSLLAGSYTITVKDANGCTFAKGFTVSDIAGPTAFTANTTSSTCGATNGSLTVSGVTGGVAPYTYSKDGSTFQASATFSGLLAGTHTITVKDANGCIFAKAVTVSDIAGPTSVSLTNASSTCGASNASITVGAVTGGTAPYTYSKDGTNFQPSTIFSGLLAGTYTITVKDANGCTVTRQTTITNIAGPSDLLATSTASTCGRNNGVLTIGSVSGGTTPYTYSKDGVNFQSATSFGSLLAGSYTITVKDANGCTFAKAFTVSDIAGPTAVAATSAPAGCTNDGTISVGTVTGGTAPYTYSINGTTFQTSTSFTALAAGTYTVTAKDANGCQVTTSINVGINVPTAFATTTTASTCGSPNGTVTITSVTGGTAPYTYSKDGVTFQSAATLTGMLARTYTITVKDAKGCVFSQTVTVTDVAAPTDLVASSKASTCGNSNAELTVTGVTGGTSPYTYSVDGGTYQSSATFTSLASGSHTILVKDANGCTISKMVTIENVAGPAFTLATQSTTCGASNGSITVNAVTAGTAPFTYSIDGTNFQASATFAALAAGSYTITVKDANGCSLAKQVTVSDIAGPTGLTLASTSTTCGNANGTINASGVTGGTAPYTFALDGGSFQTSASFTALAAGEHTITVKDANGCIFSKKIVLENIAGPSDLLANTSASTCGANNGSLTLSGVTGGTAPYTYSKDGVNFQTSATFSGILAGTYTITVKDANGCTFAKAFTVSDIAGPTAVAATSAPAGCANDGTISVGTVTGGTAPYTYSVNGTTFQASTSFTALAAGTYTVTAKDANGCQVTTSINVGTNVPTAFATTATASTCGNPNGSITINGVTGGTAPYTYSKNGTTFQASATFAGLMATTYTITVKDAKGCTFAAQVNVSNIAGPSDLVTSTKASTCGNSNAEFTVTNVTGGTAPYNYSVDGGTFQASATFGSLAAGTHTITVKDANGCIFTEDVTLINIAGPSFTLVAQSSTCGANNGTITVGAVTGGTAPYSYSLDGTNFQASTTFNNLLAGTYTIMVRDANGCALARQIVVENIAGPAGLTLATLSSTCGASNGSVTINGVTGGTAPYLFSIDGSTFQSSATISGIAAGEHTITVKDANGCIFSKKVTVENIAGPTDLVASTTSSTCGANNGSLTISNVTGGTAPYTYSKDGVNFQASATFTSLLAGSHTIIVKDANGCTFSKAFTVSDIAGPSAVAATSAPASCLDNDGSITVGTVSGGTSPYTYSINGTSFQASTSFMALASGTYTVTAKDANGCQVTASVTVGKNVPTAFASSTVTSTCGGSNGSITIGAVTGGTAPYTYSINGTTFQAITTFASLAAGTYTITVKDAKGCTFSQGVAVSNIAGPSFTVAANSSTCGSANGSVAISGVTGGVAPYSYSKDGVTFQASTSFSNLLSGTYAITVKDANGCESSQLIVVEDIKGPSALRLASNASTCGASNATVTVELVTDGTAPYTYSKDGVTFQASATFSGLLAGTHTITVKDANGCTFSKAITVTDIAGPAGLTLTSVASTCGSSNGSISAGGVTGGTAPYTFAIDGANYQTSATFSAVLAGSYTITVKDANGCTYSKQVTVTDKAGPTNLLSTTESSTCGAKNGTLTISSVTGGTAPYTYSKDGVNFQASATFTSLLAGSHTIIVKDANGCTFSKAFTVSDIAGPTAVAATSAPASCQDNDGSITVGTVSGGTAPYTYSINGTTFQASASFTALKAGTYIVTAKDANGCQVTASVTVGTNVPTAFASTTNSSTCGSPNGSITVNGVTGGTAPYTYSKDGTTFQASATFSGLMAGTHTITVKDAKGCIYTAPVQVRDIAGPSDLVASLRSSTCGSSNAELVVSNVTGGTAPYTYSKDGVNFQASTAFAGMMAGTHAITVKDANGCTFTKTFTLTDIAGPSGFTANATSSTCGNSNGSLLITAVTGGTAPYTYSKDGVNFQASATFSGLLAGTHTITVKDANGCTVVKQIKVDDIAGPTGLALASVASTCGSSNGSITVSGVTGGTAPYTFTIDGSTFQSSSTFTALLAREYTVTVKDANGCTFSNKVIVTDIAGPTNVLATAVSSTCGSSNGKLTIGNVTGGTAPYTYSKDGVNFQTATAFADLKAGTYTITVKDANGCIVSRSFTVSDIAGPTAVAASSLPASCQDNDGSITVGTITGGTAPYTYSINGTSFQASSSFTSLKAGTYTVSAKDANGCLVTGSVTVGTNVPNAFASSTVASTCGASNGSLTIGSITGGTAPYTYSKDGITFQASATFSGLLAGTHTITVKDAKGCIYTAPVKVSDIAGPSDLVASLSSSTCGNSNASLTVSGVTGGTAPYTYSVDGTTFQASATFSSLDAGTHTIMVKDANGCTFAKSYTISDIAGPSGFIASETSSTCGSSNGSISIGAITGGTAPYSYSKDGANFQASTSFGGLLAGTYTITVKDANGCTINKKVVVEDIAGPTGLTLASNASTCGSSNGSIMVDGVTGGTAPYTFSIDGSTFQASATFTSLVAREYTVTVKDANGCTFVKKVVVENIAGPTNLVATAVSSTCGSSNGSLTIGNVTGGTAPYTYSKDGVNFQTATAFADLIAGAYTITVKDANGCIVSRSFTVSDIAGPTAVAASSAPASCQDNDGSISIGTVTGGTAPYTYSINGNAFQASALFTALKAGTYTVTAKDANGCQVTTSINVGTNVPTAFASTTAASTCGSTNGSITIGAITGGTAPYTYSKDGVTFQASATFSGLLAGTHTITVKDAKGCTFARPVVLTDIPGPTAIIASANASTCGNPNGMVAVTEVTGGTAPYTYSINGTTFQASATFSALTAKDYTVTVKDANGCVITKAVKVNDIAGPSAFVMSPTASTCGASNGQVTVTGVTGGTAPYTYSKDGSTFQTSDIFTGLAAGTHTITVKDANGCPLVKQIAVENIPGPTALALTSVSSTCGDSNGSITAGTVTGGTAPFTYSKDGSNFQASATFSGLLAGAHTITVKDANGCTITQQITIGNVAGPSDLVASLKASTCGSSNGELTFTGTTGGTAPYTYSVDGTTFQASATFMALKAGSYTITVKDANGCTFSKAFTVSDIAGPSAVAATSAPASCQDNDGTITAGNVTDGTAPYTYSINGTTFQASATFSALASGTYTVTVKDANGCTATEEVVINKNVPTAFANTTTATTCGNNNGSITIGAVTGGTAPYTYSKDGSSFQASASFSGLTSGNHAITVKDAKGCTFTALVQVSDVPKITDLSAATEATTCNNSNGKITVNMVTGGTAPYTYSLDGSAFQSSSVFASLAAGSYILVVKDASNCTYSEEVLVGNTSGPSDFRFTVRTSSCGNANGQVTVSDVTGGVAPYTYSKDGTTYQASATLADLAAGTYTILVKDTNGCIFSRKVTIEGVEGPTAFTLASVSSTCGSSNGSITASNVTGGTAPYTYSVDGTTFQSAATFGSLMAGAYTVRVKDANGCTVVKQVTVDNKGGVTAIASSTTPASCSDNGTITITSSTGGSAPYTYSLDGTSFQASNTFTPLAPKDHKVYVKDANNCVAFFTVTVATTRITEAVVSATQETCGGKNGSITVGTVTGGVRPLSYSINGTTFQTSATFANLTAGAYTITVKDAEGCVLTKTQAVTNSTGAESFTLAGINASCGDNNGRISISQVVGGQSPYQYSINGTTFQGSPEFTGLAAGTYQVTVKDAQGCTLVKSTTLTNSLPPTALKATIKAAGCGQTEGQVTVDQVTGGTAPYSYSLDGVNFQASTTLTGVTAGTYQLTVKDANGCTYAQSVTIGKVESKVASVQHITCAGEKNGRITISTVGGDTQTEYSINNGVTFQKEPVFNNLAGGVYQVVTRFSATCSVTVGSVEVKEPQPIKVTVAQVIQTLNGSNLGNAEITSITGGTAPYTFMLNNGTFSTTQTFSGLKEGTHSLLVKDSNGCITETSFVIDASAELEIPNGFTPNGDGINDLWVLKNLSLLYPSCKVEVYNRWGSKVFESRGYQKAWDGTYNGAALPVGTYYTIIELGNGKPALKKSVTIMR